MLLCLTGRDTYKTESVNIEKNRLTNLQRKV